MTDDEIKAAIKHIGFNEMTAFNIARAIEAHLASTPAVSAEPTLRFVRLSNGELYLEWDGGALNLDYRAETQAHLDGGKMKKACDRYVTCTAKRQDATVRDAALESAARAVEEQHGFYGESPAKTIRAMKAKP